MHDASPTDSGETPHQGYGGEDAGTTSGRFVRYLPRTIRGLLLLLLVTLILPVLLVEVAIYFVSLETQRARILQANLEVARGASSTFDTYVNDILHQEQTLGAVLTAGTPLPSAEASKMLTTARSEYRTLTYVSWLDPQCQIVFSSEPSPPDPIYERRACFQAIASSSGWVVSDLFQGQSSGDPAFTISRAVEDAGSGARGVVVAGIDPRRLGRRLEIERSATSAVDIVDSQGIDVYRYPEVELTWGQRDFEAVSAGNLKIPANTESTATFLSPVDGQERIAGIAPISTIGWVAIASQSSAEAMATSVRDLAIHVLLLLLVGGVSVLTGTAIASAMAVPLRRLRQHAAAIGEGRFDNGPRVNWPAELSELSEAFNLMAIELRARQDGLTAANQELLVRSAESRRLAEEAQRAQDEVERKASELDLTISSIADAVMILAPDGAILRMNPAAERILSYSPEERRLPHRERLAGLHAATAEGKPLPPEEMPVTRALRGETVLGQLMTLDPSSGKRHWVSTSAAPIRTPDGRLLGAVLVLTDVTAQYELQAQQEELVQAISHDLRAPLTVIQGHAQMMLRGPESTSLGTRTRRSAEAIILASRQMNSMIQDLVDSTRMESGQLRLEKTAVNLEDFIAQMLDRLRGILDVDRIQVKVEQGLLPVFADRGRLERILINLLTNAIKYSEPGTKIIVAVSSYQAAVLVSVSDQGSGIPPEALDSLFEKYSRPAKGRKRADSLGLGLYITRGLVQAHSGRIWVESEVGRGSTFSFTLPIVGDQHEETKQDVQD